MWIYSNALYKQVELEFGNVGFYGGRKTREPREKPSERGQEPTTNSTHMTPGPGIEPGPHWWKASALTTEPSLLPKSMLLVPPNILSTSTHFYTRVERDNVG